MINSAWYFCRYNKKRNASTSHQSWRFQVWFNVLFIVSSHAFQPTQYTVKMLHSFNDCEVTWPDLVTGKLWKFRQLSDRAPVTAVIRELTLFLVLLWQRHRSTWDCWNRGQTNEYRGALVLPRATGKWKENSDITWLHLDLIMLALLRGGWPEWNRQRAWRNQVMNTEFRLKKHTCRWDRK
jgi:hypothetical protein